MPDLRKLAEARDIFRQQRDNLNTIRSVWPSAHAGIAELLDAGDVALAACDRLHDLVRHQRGPLHDAGLLTDEEYAALAADHGAVGRLETIDGLRATVAKMKAQRDADVMTALMRQSEVFDVTFATVTRERDEATKRADLAEKNVAAVHGILTDAGIPPAAWVACDDPRCQSHLMHRTHVLVAERDELRATLQHLRDIAHGALSGNSTAPDVEDAIARADAALAAGGKA